MEDWMFNNVCGLILPRELKGKVRQSCGVFRPVFYEQEMRVVALGEPGTPLPLQCIRAFRQVSADEEGNIHRMDKIEGASMGRIGDPMLIAFKKPGETEHSHLANAGILAPVLLNWLEEMADTEKLLTLDISGLEKIWQVVTLTPMRRAPSPALAQTVELLTAPGPRSMN